jgi:hypothetical protein
MPKVAKFRTIVETDEGFTLPSSNLLNDRHFLDIDFPDVDTDDRSVLLFRVRPLDDEPKRLLVDINSTNFVNIEFASTAHRSWHEIVGPNILMETDNEVTVALIGPGSIQISDIVLLYQANV